MKSPIQPVNFGRNTDTGRYQSLDGKFFSDAFAPFKAIKTDVKSIRKLLEDYLGKNKDGESQHIDKLRDSIADLADKFNRHFHEQEGFLRGLASASNALLSLDFSKYEGIYKKKEETTRVEIANLDKTLIAKPDPKWAIPILTPMMGMIRSFLGMSKKDDKQKLEIKDQDRIAHAVEDMARVMHAAYKPLSQLPGWMSRFFTGALRGGAVGALAGGLFAGAPGAGIGAAAGALFGGVKRMIAPWLPEKKVVTTPGTAPPPAVAEKLPLPQLVALLQQDLLSLLGVAQVGAIALGSIEHDMAAVVKNGQTIVKLMQLEDTELDYVAVLLEKQVEPMQDLRILVSAVNGTIRSLATFISNFAGVIHDDSAAILDELQDIRAVAEIIAEAVMPLTMPEGEEVDPGIEMLKDSTLDAIDQVAESIREALQSMPHAIKVEVVNWPEGLLGLGVETPPGPTPGKPTQLVPDAISKKATFQDWNEMNPEQKKKYRANKEAMAEEAVEEQKRRDEADHAEFLWLWRKIKEEKRHWIKAAKTVFGDEEDEDKTEIGPDEDKDKTELGPGPGSSFMGKGTPRGKRRFGESNFLGGGVGELFAGIGSFGSIASAGSSITSAIGGITALGEVTAVAVPVLATLGVVLVPLAAAVVILAAAVAGVVATLYAFVTVTNAAINAVQKMAEASIGAGVAVGRGILDSFGKIASGDIFGALNSGAMGFVSAMDQMGQATLSLIPLVGGLLSGVFHQLVGVVQLAGDALTGFASHMIPLVQQISPATVENFNYQMRGLQATFGVAFTGFIATFANTIQTIAGVFLPLADELRPLFTELASVLRSGIVPVMKVFAALIGAILSPLRGAMDGLRRVVLDVVKNFIILAAMIARMFGANDFLDRLMVNLRRPEGAGATPVGNAQITSIEQIGKDIAVAAAQASVGAGAEAAGPSAEDLLGDIGGILREIRAEGLPNLMDRFEESLGNFWLRVQEFWLQQSAAFIEWASTNLGPIFDRVVDRVLNWLRDRFPATADLLDRAANMGSGLLNAGMNAWSTFTNPTTFGF